MQFFFFVDRIPPHTVAISGTTETGGALRNKQVGGGYAGYIGPDRPRRWTTCDPIVPSWVRVIWIRRLEIAHIDRGEVGSGAGPSVIRAQFGMF
jgi:hypothetical protein